MGYDVNTICTIYTAFVSYIASVLDIMFKLSIFLQVSSELLISLLR